MSALLGTPTPDDQEARCPKCALDADNCRCGACHRCGLIPACPNGRPAMDRMWGRFLTCNYGAPKAGEEPDDASNGHQQPNDRS